MKVLKGISAQGGIVAGVVCLYAAVSEESLPHYSVTEQQAGAEVARLEEAFANAKKEMRRMVDVARENRDKDAADIFNTHLMMLSDPSLLNKAADLVRTRLINAEHAVSDIFESYISRYEAAEGHFRELTHDFIDAKNRVLAGFNMEAGKFKCDVGTIRPVIVAAKRLTPSMTLSVKKGNVLAFIAEEGGFTSHATIIARSYGVPIIFGVKVDEELECGMNVIADGSSGKVIVSPDEATADYYSRKIENIKSKQLACGTKKHHAAETKSGQRISLKLNITTPEELTVASGMPHDGIGLLRTEFLFMHRDMPPPEEDQVKMYESIFSMAGGSAVTVRLLDIGTDKLPPFFKLPPVTNADLELRGAIAVEIFPELYITQVKALLKACVRGNLRLLFPMVSDLSDLATFRGMVRKAKAALKKEKAVFYEGKIKEGIMIETPAAVMMADELASETDFINIGSNDLISYTLAAQRGGMMAEKRYHILHPALVKMLEKTARAGKKAGKEVCLCGEIAGFEEYYPVLLQTGLSSFSVSVSKFDDIKCQLMHTGRTKSGKILKAFYGTRSKEDADKYFSKFI